MDIYLYTHFARFPFLGFSYCISVPGQHREFPGGKVLLYFLYLSIQSKQTCQGSITSCCHPLQPKIWWHFWQDMSHSVGAIQIIKSSGCWFSFILIQSDINKRKSTATRQAWQDCMHFRHRISVKKKTYAYSQHVRFCFSLICFHIWGKKKCEKKKTRLNK